MKNLENKNAENNSDNLKWYFENEKNLTILAKRGKNPIVKNWLDRLLPYSKITEYFRNGYNVGFVLSDTDLVVDCDPRWRGSGAGAVADRTLLREGDARVLRTLQDQEYRACAIYRPYGLRLRGCRPRGIS